MPVLSLLLLSPLVLSVLAQTGAEVSVVRPLRAQCSQLLQGLAGSKMSDLEIAAYCRAAYSLDVCRTLRSSMGSLPWTTARIETSCAGWQSKVLSQIAKRPPERRAMEYAELQTKLDASAENKERISTQLPRKADGQLDVDKAVLLKSNETQNMSDAYNQYLSQDNAMEWIPSLRGSPQTMGTKPAMQSSMQTGAASSTVSQQVSENVAPRAVDDSPLAKDTKAPKQTLRSRWGAGPTAADTKNAGSAVPAESEPANGPEEILPIEASQGLWARLTVARTYQGAATTAIVGFALVVIAMIGGTSRLISRSSLGSHGRRSRREWTQLPNSDEPWRPAE